MDRMSVWIVYGIGGCRANRGRCPWDPLVRHSERFPHAHRSTSPAPGEQPPTHVPPHDGVSGADPRVRSRCWCTEPSAVERLEGARAPAERLLRAPVRPTHAPRTPRYAETTAQADGT